MKSFGFRRAVLLGWAKRWRCWYLRHPTSFFDFPSIRALHVAHPPWLWTDMFGRQSRAGCLSRIHRDLQFTELKVRDDRQRGSPPKHEQNERPRHLPVNGSEAWSTYRSMRPSSTMGGRWGKPVVSITREITQYSTQTLTLARGCGPFINLFTC